MKPSSDMLAEIESQLQDDILHFGWLCQIARDLHPSFAEWEIVDCVISAVSHLAKDRLIVVGAAAETNGMVQIQPWPVRPEELPIQIIKAMSSGDREFCFWIQLTKHYAA